MLRIRETGHSCVNRDSTIAGSRWPCLRRTSASVAIVGRLFHVEHPLQRAVALHRTRHFSERMARSQPTSKSSSEIAPIDRTKQNRHGRTPSVHASRISKFPRSIRSARTVSTSTDAAVTASSQSLDALPQNLDVLQADDANNIAQKCRLSRTRLNHRERCASGNAIRKGIAGEPPRNPNPTIGTAPARRARQLLNGSKMSRSSVARDSPREEGR